MSGVLKCLLTTLPEGSTCENLPSGIRKGGVSLAGYLSTLKHDFISGICGQIRPLSSLNSIWVLVRCYVLFLDMEERLSACRNPIWVQVYEGNPRFTQHKRLSHTVLAVRDIDQECLRIMADVFGSQGGGFIDHVY